MNDLIEHPISQTDDIILRINFVDGDTFTQDIPVDRADFVEELLDWYRFRKKKQTFSFDYGPYRKLKVFNRNHITAIEIDNYIELARTSYKWHEKMRDKILTFLIFFRMKGGDYIGESEGESI